MEKRGNDYKPLKSVGVGSLDNLSFGCRVEDILSQNQGVEASKLVRWRKEPTENPRSSGPLTGFSAARYKFSYPDVV